MSMSKEQFNQLSEGLLYMSETDAPLSYYEMDLERSQQWPPSTAGQFLQLIGEDPEAPVEELAPEKFFRDLRPGNEDHEDQMAALRRAMTEELKNLEGFRVGEIQIKIFVLGKDDSGNVCGLQTLSVET
jgi:nuclease A inhibitor-like protein